MSRLWRVFAAVMLSTALTAALAVVVAPTARADAKSDLRTDLAASLVQVNTIVSGQVEMDFAGDKIWSKPVQIQYTSVGFAVDDRGTIVVSGLPVDVNNKNSLERLREQAVDHVAATLKFDADRTAYIKGVAEASRWKVAESESNPHSPVKMSMEVRSVGSANPVIAQQTATLVAIQPTGHWSQLALIRATGNVSDLQPLPIGDGMPKVADQLIVGGITHEEFASEAPQVALTNVQVDSIPEASTDDDPHVTLTPTLARWNYGAPLLDKSGVVQGVVTVADPAFGAGAADLRAFMEASGVDPVSAAAEDDGTSLWLWLGPLIGVLAVLVAVLAGVLVRRRRKPAAVHPPFPGALQANGFAPHAQQFMTPPPGTPQQFPTPPPGAPAAFDQTQIAPRPDGPTWPAP